MDVPYFSQGLVTSQEHLDCLWGFFRLYTFDTTHSISCLVHLAYKNLGQVPLYLAPQNQMSGVKTVPGVLPLKQLHSGAPL